MADEDDNRSTAASDFIQLGQSAQEQGEDQQEQQQTELASHSLDTLHSLCKLALLAGTDALEPALEKLADEPGSEKLKSALNHLSGLWTNLCKVSKANFCQKFLVIPKER
jgi:hypothetical protein